MFRPRREVYLCTCIAVVAGMRLLGGPVMAAGSSDGLVLPGRSIATGIPGASAISAVGTFHPGGPIHDDPHFAALTLPGQVLDSRRILVASTSSFGGSASPLDY